MARMEEYWLDQRIPALGGRSPREAVDDPIGREEVRQLLAGFPRPSPAMPVVMDPDRIRGRCPRPRLSAESFRFPTGRPLMSAARYEVAPDGSDMGEAIILTVDDDPAVSQAITRDLRSRYGDRYRIVPGRRRAPRR